MGGRRVLDLPGARRYEIHEDGTVAGHLRYAPRPGLVALVHTEIDPAYEGKGVGTDLVAAVLDHARAAGLAVLPFCPFVNAWIRRHPGYADLVPADRREQFGL